MNGLFGWFRSAEEKLRTLTAELTKTTSVSDKEMRRWADLMKKTDGRFLKEVLSEEIWKDNPGVGRRLIDALPENIKRREGEYLGTLMTRLTQLFLKQGAGDKFKLKK
jgi:hypothetical protein